MKRFAFLFLAVLLLSVFSESFAEGARYRYQAFDMESGVNDDGADAFIAFVRSLREDHPLIMTQEWADRLTALGEDYASGLPMPDLKSEYDIFDDVTYKWFGDSRKASPDDPCAIVCIKTGWHIRFFLKVDDWITVNNFTAITDSRERITGYVYNDDFKSEKAVRYESFDVNVDVLQWETAPQTLAFRFYGKKNDEYIDYYMTDEEVSQISRLKKMLDGKKAIRDAAWEWAREMDGIIDPTIPPANFHVFLENGYPIFPITSTTADLHMAVNQVDYKLKQSLEDSSYSYVPGSVYFLPCTVSEIQVPSVSLPQHAWIVKLKGPYDTENIHPCEVRVEVDHAVEMGWVTDEPAPGDEVLLLATYYCFGNTSWMPVFQLGYDDYIRDLTVTK